MRFATPDEVARRVNDPSVLPFVAPGYPSIDVSSIFDDPANVALYHDGGIMLFLQVVPGMYETHYLGATLAQAREMIAELFTSHGAVAICGNTPRDNRAARVINRALGAKPVGHAIDASGRLCVDYLLERDQWVLSSAES